MGHAGAGALASRARLSPAAQARFGLCIPKGRCKDGAVKWLLLPMLWAYVHHGPQVNYQDPGLHF